MVKMNVTMESEDFLRFSKDHLWIRLEDDIATIGVTHHAQERLGDVFFVELPDLGDIDIDSPCATIESIKTASEIYAPLAGEIVEINTDLRDDPGKINFDPQETGWLFRLRIFTTRQFEALMKETEYLKLVS